MLFLLYLRFKNEFQKNYKLEKFLCLVINFAEIDIRLHHTQPENTNP